MIIKCVCVHEGQDKLHGKGMRVYNPGKDAGGGVKWRCTVCQKETTVKENPNKPT